MLLANVHVYDVYPASGNEHDFLPRDCVHGHVDHEQFLYGRGHDDSRCDCANAYEPPLDVSGDVHVFQYL